MKANRSAVRNIADEAQRNPNSQPIIQDKTLQVAAFSSSRVSRPALNSKKKQVLNGNFNLCPGDGQGEAVPSFCGGDERYAGDAASLSPAGCSKCGDLLHQLSNAMTGVLMNAQVLGWKLPPYSHLKRLVREVERNAQRGGELLKQLTHNSAMGSQETLEAAQSGGCSAPEDGSGARPRVAPYPPADLEFSSPPDRRGNESPDILRHQAWNLTMHCDQRPSGIFPKRDDSNES